MDTENLLDVLLYANNNHNNYFDMFAYKINFSFDLNEYKNSIYDYKSNKIITQNLLITLHEYYHFFEVSFTPFGEYIRMLYQYSEVIVINLLKYINEKYNLTTENGDSIIDIIHNNKDLIYDDYITELLFDWLNIDLIISYLCFNDNYDIFLNKYNKYSNIRLDNPNFFICKKIADIDEKLYSHLDCTKRGFTYYKYNNIDFSEDKKEEALFLELSNIKLKLLKLIPSTRSIYESLCRASELFLIKDNIDLNFLHDPISNELFYYHYPLQIALNKIPAENNTEFLLSFMAICEIVLSPPSLPQSSNLRSIFPSILEFDPGYRFYCVLPYLSNIKPIKNIETDYERYISELCSCLSWPTPLDISKGLLKNYKHLDGDIIAKLFLQFHKQKIKHEYLFIDVYSLLNILIDNFSFCPMVQFKDEILINHFLDDEIALTEVYFTLNYLKKLYLESVMYNIPNQLKFPYITTSNTLMLYEELFYNTMQSLGIRLKKIKIINP